MSQTEATIANVSAPDWASVTNKPSTFTPGTHTHETLPVTAFTTLANGTTALELGTNGVVKVTPTATATLTTTVPPAGTRCAVIVLTSGTTSYTLTFGTGFKPVGTLATGTVTNRVFVINFISDGTRLYEAGRTAAMAA